MDFSEDRAGQGVTLKKDAFAHLPLNPFSTHPIQRFEWLKPLHFSRGKSVTFSVSQRPPAGIHSETPLSCCWA
jgi:hypothetical protein